MNRFMTTLPNELMLVRQASVEPAAFAAIYDHYFPRIYNYVRYRVHDSPTADDLTADVFERVLRKISHYRPERAPFGAWVFAIARHAVSDYLRRQHRRQLVSLDAILRRPSSQPELEIAAEVDDAKHELLAALQTLNVRERDLIALKFTSGLTNRRIADMTKLSESNVGVILYRAMQKLKTRLDPQGDQ
jgi:RNA polymerase sigma-70 factor (ECF subfamily)